jgi:hypothetical protein
MIELMRRYSKPSGHVLRMAETRRRMRLVNNMTTLEPFGVPGFEAILLDPDGKLVDGDEATLANVLKK